MNPQSLDLESAFSDLPEVQMLTGRRKLIQSMETLRWLHQSPQNCSKSRKDREQGFKDFGGEVLVFSPQHLHQAEVLSNQMIETRPSPRPPQLHQDTFP